MDGTVQAAGSESRRAVDDILSDAAGPVWDNNTSRAALSIWVDIDNPGSRARRTGGPALTPTWITRTLRTAGHNG
jgi:hypothetical protein